MVRCWHFYCFYYYYFYSIKSNCTTAYHHRQQFPRYGDIYCCPGTILYTHTHTDTRAGTILCTHTNTPAHTDTRAGTILYAGPDSITLGGIPTPADTRNCRKYSPTTLQNLKAQTGKQAAILYAISRGDRLEIILVPPRG